MAHDSSDMPSRGIFFMLLGTVVMSVNDMLIKLFSDGYPLHQMVFLRAMIGLVFTLTILQLEGGFKALRTNRPGLHALRGLLIFIANMCFFSALAVLPLADATALFYVAPLLITLLSIPFLGEKVGVRRFAAVIVGFIGVLIMMRPGGDVPGGADAPSRLVLLLPILGALAYASMQILTRRLGAETTAAAMAVYLQLTFLSVSALFWAVAGDGRYAVGVEDESLVFLLRPWVWPPQSDWPAFFILGLTSAIISYSLSQAYRSAKAATIAPFEYAVLPLSIFWGWTMFGHFPDAWVLSGIALIAGAGVYVFVREGARARTVASSRQARRL